MELLEVPQGSFQLRRYPARNKDQLRAWDAADEYLLHHIAEVDAAGGRAREVDGGEVLIVNDLCGSLSTALASRHPSVLSDSFVSHCATAANMAHNVPAAGPPKLLGSLDQLPPRLDLVLVKVPKHQSLLADQLARIAPALHSGTVVVGAGMTKHVHSSTLAMFEEHVGPTTTTRARKKARLICSEVGSDRACEPPPSPVGHRDQATGLTVVGSANVFAAGRLDAGTRFLLEHLPATTGSRSIVDLGCGSGVLGTAAALDNPDADLTFIDESYLAIASAEATFRANVGAGRQAEFLVGDCLGRTVQGLATADGSIDLILNNPPFHDNHALADAVAWQMFSESRAALRSGGELWVVGNRHLAYHAKLKRLFGNCEVVAGNAKFVVLRACRVGLRHEGGGRR